MPRANRKPTATAAVEHPAGEPSVAELCREWRLVNAKREYDSAALPDTDEDEAESDRLVEKANERTIEIELALAASAPDTIDDIQGLLRVVAKNMEEEFMGEDRDGAMVKAAIQALTTSATRPARHCHGSTASWMDVSTALATSSQRSATWQDRLARSTS